MILIVTMSLALFSNLVLNSSVVYALIKTKQLNNISMKLILCLSVSDVLLAVLGQSLFVLMLSTSSWDVSNCSIDTAVEFLVLFFVHTSAYIILLIGYDRYYRIRYLNRYSQVVKHCYLQTALMVAVLLSVLEVSMQVVGIQYHFWDVSSVIALGIDGCIIAVMLLPYALTMFTMKQRVRKSSDRSILETVDNVVSTMTSRILVAILVTYLPYVIFSVVRTVGGSIVNREWFNVCLFFSYVVACSNSSLNAIIFISLNGKTRRTLFGCFTKGSGRMSEVEMAVVCPIDI